MVVVVVVVVVIGSGASQGERRDGEGTEQGRTNVPEGTAKREDKWEAGGCRRDGEEAGEAERAAVGREAQACDCSRLESRRIPKRNTPLRPRHGSHASVSTD